MVVFEKIQDVTRSIARADYDQLETQIEALEQLLEKKNRSNLYLQYLTFAKGMLKYGRGGTYEEVVKLFMNAIHMTLPNFDGVTPNENNLLTFHEIAIIDNIATMYAEQNMMEQALRLG